MLKPASKTSLKSLEGVANYTWNGVLNENRGESLYSFLTKGFRYDFLLNIKESANTLFVLFSGDALRKKNDPPVFQRWTWSSVFPGHCLYISDPMLFLDKKMGLAWYAGNKEHDPMLVISDLVKSIASQLNVRLCNIISYGSSGGGYAALRLPFYLPESSSIAINPQTQITAFEQPSVERYLRNCWEIESRAKALDLYGEKLSLLQNITKYKNKRILIAQNELDLHHYKDHYLPFLDALNNATLLKNNKDIVPLTFRHEGGHKKAETEEVFYNLIEIAKTWERK